MDDKSSTTLTCKSLRKSASSRSNLRTIKSLLLPIKISFSMLHISLPNRMQLTSFSQGKSTVKKLKNNFKRFSYACIIHLIIGIKKAIPITTEMAFAFFSRVSAHYSIDYINQIFTSKRLHNVICSSKFNSFIDYRLLPHCTDHYYFSLQVLTFEHF